MNAKRRGAEITNLKAKFICYVKNVWKKYSYRLTNKKLNVIIVL